MTPIMSWKSLMEALVRGRDTAADDDSGRDEVSREACLVGEDRGTDRIEIPVPAHNQRDGKGNRSLEAAPVHSTSPEPMLKENRECSFDKERQHDDSDEHLEEASHVNMEEVGVHSLLLSAHESPQLFRRFDYLRGCGSWEDQQMFTRIPPTDSARFEWPF